MTSPRLLLVGESWITSATHYKGWDQFGTVTYHSGAGDLLKALRDAGIVVEYLPGHDAPANFPMTLPELQKYDVIMLSDIGSNTLLLHPDTWLHGKRTPNRLKLLREFTEAGGGLSMIGGYYSFAGLHAGARYGGTPVEDALPVTISPTDDRMEDPEGSPIVVHQPSHPILAGIEGEWPHLLGYNKVTPRSGSEVLASVGGDPLLVVGRYGNGRTLAWTSDIGPHWCPTEFVEWPGYAQLFRQAVRWLSQKGGGE